MEDRIMQLFICCKGFFDKAKKKIMGDKDTNPFIEQNSSSGGDVTNYSQGLSGYDSSWWEPQDFGKCVLL